MWIEPVCDGECNVTVDLMELTLEQLMKINEYRTIKSSVKQFYMEEQEQDKPPNR